MKKSRKDPSAYLASLPENGRKPMMILDQLIRGVMKAHSRRLWTGTFWGGSDQAIIGYGDFRTTRAGGEVVEWFMVGLALQKRYFSVYVNAVADGRYLAETFAPVLGRVKVGKASISFATIEDVDLKVLRRLITTARKQLDTTTPPSAAPRRRLTAR